MKSRTIITAAILLAVLPVMISGTCIQTDPKQEILGKWVAIGEDRSMEFMADGTIEMGVKVMGVSVALSGSYNWTGEDTIKAELDGVGAFAGPQNWTVTFPAKDQLSIKDQRTGAIVTYSKKM